MKLIIGNKAYSSWSMRGWLACKQSGLSFEELIVPLYGGDWDNIRETENFAPSGGKVPILWDGESVIWDSLAIMEYLADKNPETVSWPAYIKARATARAVSSEMHSSFTALRNEMPMNCRAQYKDVNLSEDCQKDIARIIALWRHCKRFYGQDGKWLFSQFTIADAMFAPVVIRLKHFNIPLEGVEAEYAEVVYNNKHVQSWIQAGIDETEVIEQAELTPTS